MKNLLVVLVCIFTILSLVSCKSEGFEPKLDTSEEVTLYFVGDYNNFEALEAVVADFKGVYPNITIVYEKLDDYYNTGLANRMASNKDIDLLMDAYDSNVNKDNLSDLSKIGADFGVLKKGVIENLSKGSTI